MEKMYKDYRDLVEVRLVYIREAHAIGLSRHDRTRYWLAPALLKATIISS